MKVCIVGCGSIGGLYGAHLARLDDVEVWAFDLDREHVDAINTNGLRLTGLSDFVATVHARTEVEEIPECEFGIIATKTMFTRSAMKWPRRYSGMAQSARYKTVSVTRS